MKNSRALELAVGVFMALGLAALFMLAMKVSNLAGYEVEDGYRLVAYFDNVGGLKPKAPVKVAGVTVGRVESVDYDNQAFQAVVTLMINPRYNQFPKDSSASIFTAGLLGEQYVALEPGAEEVVLAEGDRIVLTQSSLVLEQVIGQFLYSKAAE